MTVTLNAGELIALVARVFVPTLEDVALGVMIDLPDERMPDDAAWMARRQIAAEWVELLDAKEEMVGYRTRLLLYPTGHTNKGDLPARCGIQGGARVPGTAAELNPAGARPMGKIFDTFPMLM